MSTVNPVENLLTCKTEMACALTLQKTYDLMKVCLYFLNIICLLHALFKGAVIEDKRMALASENAWKFSRDRRCVKCVYAQASKGVFLDLSVYTLCTGELLNTVSANLCIKIDLPPGTEMPCFRTWQWTYMTST